MTIGEWLGGRAAPAPPRLAAAIRTALAADLDGDASSAPERCLEAADGIVARLLQDDDTGRGSALALLTADALVTYAFEAAAADPGRLRARAESAMQQLARLP